MRGEPAVVVEEVEGDRRRPGLPDPRERLGVQRHRRGDAAADQQRPPGERRRALGVRVADQGRRRGAGACSSTAASRSGSRSRIGSIRLTPISTGGWCRQTNAGAVVLGELLVQPGQRRRRSARRGRSAPPAAPTPASRASGTGRPAGPSTWSSRPSASRSSSPSGERVADVVVAGADQQRPGPAVQDRPRRGVLLGEPWSAMSPVTRSTSGRGSSARRWSSDPVARGARASRRPAEVQVAEVGDVNRSSHAVEAVATAGRRPVTRTRRGTRRRSRSPAR